MNQMEQWISWVQQIWCPTQHLPQNIPSAALLSNPFPEDVTLTTLLTMMSDVYKHCPSLLPAQPPNNNLAGHLMTSWENLLVLLHNRALLHNSAQQCAANRSTELSAQVPTLPTQLSALWLLEPSWCNLSNHSSQPVGIFLPVSWLWSLVMKLGFLSFL